LNTVPSAHSIFLLLADAVLALHFAIVAFVVGGLVFIIVGNVMRWRWVNALWFRLAHVAAIAIVAAEAWLGIACPLTTLEWWLRTQSGVTTGLAYRDSFVGYWLHRVLFYSAPSWVFVLAYSVFGLMVVAAWFFFPPHSNRRSAKR
jgi:polyferredoxin